MNPNDLMKWQQERAKELFAISHKLLETAKQLSEHQVAEMKASMDHAKLYAKQAATNDMAKLKALQEQFAEDAQVRMASYQKKIKSILKNIEHEAVDEVEKHINKALDAMEHWLKNASKNMPAGSEKFADMIRDVADAGHKVLKEGRKMAKQAAEAAESSMAKMERAKPAAKKAPARKAAAKKATARRR